MRGALPGNLSIRQPTKFELVISARHYRAAGALARVDEVIE